MTAATRIMIKADARSELVKSKPTSERWGNPSRVIDEQRPCAKGRIIVTDSRPRGLAVERALVFSLRQQRRRS